MKNTELIMEIDPENKMDPNPKAMSLLKRLNEGIERAKKEGMSQEDLDAGLQAMLGIDSNTTSAERLCAINAVQSDRGKLSSLMGMIVKLEPDMIVYDDLAESNRRKMSRSPDEALHDLFEKRTDDEVVEIGGVRLNYREAMKILVCGNGDGKKLSIHLSDMTGLPVGADLPEQDRKAWLGYLEQLPE